MAMTTSISFPNIFDTARNVVAVREDNDSIVNRTRLLILSEPTSLYNSPNFGVGLKRHLWQYNTENQKAIIRDRIVDQLRLHEPCVDPDDTQFSPGLLFTGDPNEAHIQKYQSLEMTVGLRSIFTNERAEVGLDDLLHG